MQAQAQKQQATAITSRSTDSMLLLATNQTEKNSRELPYTQLSVTLDSNQNYKKYEPTTTNRMKHRRNSLVIVDTTTVIPNYYSIRKEVKRELKLSKQVNFANLAHLFFPYYFNYISNNFKISIDWNKTKKTSRNIFSKTSLQYKIFAPLFLGCKYYLIFFKSNFFLN